MALDADNLPAGPTLPPRAVVSPRSVAIALVVLSASLTLVAAAAGTLNLTPAAVAWIGIIQGTLAVVIGFLPAVHRVDRPDG